MQYFPFGIWSGIAWTYWGGVALVSWEGGTGLNLVDGMHENLECMGREWKEGVSYHVHVASTAPIRSFHHPISHPSPDFWNLLTIWSERHIPRVPVVENVYRAYIKQQYGTGHSKLDRQICATFTCLWNKNKIFFLCQICLISIPHFESVVYARSWMTHIKYDTTEIPKEDFEATVQWLNSELLCHIGVSLHELNLQ